MWLVKRYSLTKVRSIQPDIKTALIRYFIENETLSVHQLREALALLQEAHENGYWLACDCIKNISEPPLMYIRRLETGQLSLVRMPNRTAHPSFCAFKFTENQNESSAKSSSQIKAWNKLLPLNLHRSLETSLTAGKKEDKEKSSSTSVRIPRLGRLLYTLLTDAGLTKVQKDISKLAEQFSSIKSQASQYALAGKIPIEKFFWTFATQQGFAAVQLKNTAVQWPTSVRPYGIFLLLVERFENNTAYCLHHGNEIPFHIMGNLVFSSGRLSKFKGPFLLIATFTDSTAKPGSFDPMNGFAIPVYSNHLLVPVESHYERRVLQKLIQLSSALRKKNISLAIEKPLFDITIDNVEMFADCRPDFLLKTEHQSIVLEVMGSNEEDYTNRKTRTHQMMKNLGELISFDAFEAERMDQWNEQLNNLCKIIYRIVL